ncbi:MAG: hypothetical protein H0W78_05375 [Planctomycetes bacterium]|jgi:hypothetical protein|nr:hypothetical protein [Planctomycetota bacterium]
MRTTIDLDQALLRLARKRALESHRTLSQVMEEALRAGLATKATSVTPVDLPVINGQGPAPTWEIIRAALNDDDLRLYGPHLKPPSVNDAPG